jgi:hypothetical protein
MEIRHKYSSKIKFPEIVVREYDFDKFCTKYRIFSDIVSEMKNIINVGFKNYLVNVVSADYKAGERTCSDTRYHIDGDFNSGNEYCVWCSGVNRTIFPSETIEFQDFPADRNSQNVFLEKTLKDKKYFEIPNQTFVYYSSKDPHKGVNCKKSGNRVFIRLMGTNYIGAKNYAKI